jgi:hypothetical protein
LALTVFVKLEHITCLANEVKVVASLAAFKKLNEGAEQCRYCKSLTELSIMLLYGSDGLKVACIDPHAIKAAES